MASVNDLGSVLCVCIFWNSLKTIGIKSSSSFCFFCFVLCFGLFFFSETRFLCIGLAVLELTL